MSDFFLGTVQWRGSFSYATMYEVYTHKHIYPPMRMSVYEESSLVEEQSTVHMSGSGSQKRQKQQTPKKSSFALHCIDEDS